MSDSLELSEASGANAECDTAAIHLSGAIQGRGACLFFDPSDFRIHHASENLKSFLQTDQDPLGAKLTHFIDGEFVQAVQTAVQAFPWRSRGRHLEYRGRRQRFEVYLYKSGELFSLEFEKWAEVPGAPSSRDSIDQQLEEFTDEFRNLSTTESVAHLVCQKLRKITGLHRVMMYRFVQPQWHGEVIAEDRVIDAHSFQGHRFPSSDIPKPARELYLKNRVRWISDIDEPVSVIRSALSSSTKLNLDLSDSRLRSVPLVHLDYLRNMGVKCSMSFAVTVKEQLWGLVACHHMEDIVVSQEQRLACEFIVNAFAAQGPLLEQFAEERQHKDFVTGLQQFLRGMTKTERPLESLFRAHTQICQLFDVSGIAFVSNEKVEAAGITPLRADLKTLSELLQREMDKRGQDLLVTKSLSADYSEVFKTWSGDPQLQKMVSGLIAIRIPSLKESVFFLFRPELIKTITWGGDPIKQLDKKKFPGPLNPRVSFEAWREVVRNNSKPWKLYEIEGAQTLKEFVFDTLISRTV